MNKLALILLIILFIISPLMAINIGVANVSIIDAMASLLTQTGMQEDAKLGYRIIFELRLPRVLLALLTGSGLALAGLVLQTVTRNPLADPYLFGISSGATLGAVLVITASSILGAMTPFLVSFGIQLGAFLGSLAAVFIVLSLAGRSVQIERLILAGVATSFMFGAATSLVLYSSDPQAAASLLFWTLGSFTRADWSSLLPILLILMLTAALFIGFSRQLNVLLSGDENARALGVRVGQLRLIMLLLTSLLTAILVANTGGIGFVGLMIPHIARRLYYRHSRHIMWITLLLGGVFMVWVDVIARVLVSGHELPIGIITAAVGSVFFLMVMRRPRWTE